jgi:hypothetical protein
MYHAREHLTIRVPEELENIGIVPQRRSCFVDPVHLVKYPIDYAPPHLPLPRYERKSRRRPLIYIYICINNDAAAHKFSDHCIFKNDAAALFNVIYIFIINDAAAKLSVSMI